MFFIFFTSYMLDIFHLPESTYISISFILLAAQYTIMYQSGWSRLSSDNKHHQILSGFTLQVYCVHEVCCPRWRLSALTVSVLWLCLPMYVSVFAAPEESMEHLIWTLNMLLRFQEITSACPTSKEQGRVFLPCTQKERGQEILVSTSNIYHIYQWINIT